MINSLKQFKIIYLVKFKNNIEKNLIYYKRNTQNLKINFKNQRIQVKVQKKKKHIYKMKYINCNKAININ